MEHLLVVCAKQGVASKKVCTFCFLQVEVILAIAGAKVVNFWIWLVLRGSKRKRNNSQGERSGNRRPHL